MLICIYYDNFNITPIVPVALVPVALVPVALVPVLLYVNSKTPLSFDNRAYQHIF